MPRDRELVNQRAKSAMASNRETNIKIIAAQIDPTLIPNSKYIGPGLGDFGDRYFGTNWKFAL